MSGGKKISYGRRARCGKSISRRPSIQGTEGPRLRRTLESLLELLDVDRRATLGLDRLDADWPVVLSVPLDPATYDALRFLSSLYPASPRDILRASVMRALDPGAAPPPSPTGAAPMSERTARLELGLEREEADRLRALADAERVTPEELALRALHESLGPLLRAHRPR
jgi:hypothetical protein